MMNACVFVGPTLPPEDLASFGAEGFSVRPPVALGDVWRAARSRPRAIGIIDGYFDGVPAVWHKEILWAMAQGVHVFGSASMGALRAAELAAFGMIGVGAIFAACRDGALEDDDEVAVLHGPAETGFLALSEPLVNVRATLDRARQESLVDASLADWLLGRARGISYRARTWPLVLEQAGNEGADPARLERLRAWLAHGRVDQKRVDALAMLDAMRAFLSEDPAPKEVDFHFEWTVMWDDAIRSFEAGREARAAQPRSGGAPVIEELKLEPGSWQRAREAARVRLWTGREAERRRLVPSEAQIGRALTSLRERHGIYTRRALDQWLDANDLDRPALERLLTAEARLAMLEDAADDQVDDALVDQLRLNGSYARLSERARAKLDHLAAAGALDADPRLVGLAPLALRRWFFESRLAQPMPDDVGAFARASGFADLTDFDRALAREYLYSGATAGGAQT